MPIIKQNLPRMPLPPLKQTMERYLNSCKPFLTDEEYKITENLTNEFSKSGGEGETLQQYLEERVQNTENWLADLWLNYAYLDFRSPLPVYSSTGNLHPIRKVTSKSDQLAFAASAIAGILDFKEKLCQSDFPIQKMGPYQLDMAQYYNFLGSCRIPGESTDTRNFMDHENPMKHIAVVHNCHFFCVPVYDDKGAALNQSQIVAQLEKVVAQSPEISNAPVGIFTTEHRDTWYKIYTSLKQDATNASNMDIIATSLFLLCLDGPASPVERSASSPYIAGALKMLHGGGSKGYAANRWCDKGIQIVIGENGELGCPFEHSMGEGNPIAVLMDHAESYSQKRGGKDDPVPPAKSQFSPPQLLRFNTPEDVQKCFSIAYENIDRIVENLDVYVFEYKNYGKGFIKTQNFSPDSYFQMAVQYAFYKHYKIPSAQYEAAALRMFQHGRTETIRSCSMESVNFARIMLNPEAKDIDKAIALKDAVNSHKKYVGQAVEGQAVDRHLLGLRLMATQHDIEEPMLFKDTAFIKSTNMRLSTSQVAMVCDAYVFFGPLVPDGYGCCYTMREEKMTVSMTAFNSSEETSSIKFSQTLASCLNDMREMLISAEKNK